MTQITKPNGIELGCTVEQYREDMKLSAEVLGISPMVACFGGSSIRGETTYKDDAKRLAGELAKSGISLITGGGSGIMDAVNAGAYGVDAKYSYGLRVKAIRDEMEEGTDCIDNEHLKEYNTLSIRLLTLISCSDAVVFFPGGFGTLEEMFSLLVRIRVGMMKRIPVYFYGETFWTGLKQWMTSEVLNVGAIKAEDLALFKIENGIDAIARQIIDELC